MTGGDFYQDVSDGIRRKALKGRAPALELGSVIRSERERKKMTGAELSRSAGLDARTLHAIEKGRIKNPSLKMLDKVAGGLGVAVSGLFRRAETASGKHVVLGTPRGFFHLDFPQWGIKVVSFTPWMQEFFCGKFIFGARKKLPESLLPGAPLFASVLVGRFEAQAEDEKYPLKEGESLFLSGKLRHSFQNLLEKESVLQIVTAPSFLALRQGEGLPIPSRKR